MKTEYFLFSNVKLNRYECEESDIVELINDNENVMRRRISKSDFRFEFSGNGHYKATYISPVTFKEYKTVVNFMPLIDSIKDNDKPKIKDLYHLKQLCKG